MHPVSNRFLQAIRTSHVRQTSATHRDPSTGTETKLDITDGSVTVDATAAIRRSLSLTVPAAQATWDALTAPGGEITVTQRIRYVDGQTETVPLGVFIVDADSIGYGTDGTIALTCPDRWLKVQRNRFGLARSSVAGNTVWQEIRRLVEGCWGGAFPFPGWAQLDQSATSRVGPVLWDDGDREKAVNDLATSAGLEVFFAPDGRAVLRKIPTLTTASVPVWTVDASQQGVLVDASRTSSMERTRNAVIVSSSAADAPLFPPQEVRLSTAGDPLRAGGPLGYVPDYWSSPVLKTAAAAQQAGRALLAQKVGVARQLSLEAVSNPALDASDVIEVVLPRIDRTTTRPVEKHIIDSVSVPFSPGGTQAISTRSTRPDTDTA